LAELMKSQHIGQIFVSRTRPGITRGNHYHDSKVEKFMVLEGDAVIRFRHVLGGEVIEYPVSGHEFRVVDIPPGYTHSIENVGRSDMIVLFWAGEIFNPGTPDTFGLEV
jgi:UDP-2-acetamido-2,6-beta-L-arabino-hexul-4-ose reductase